MASITITNLTSGDLLLQELYVTLGAGKSLTTNRYHDALHSMPRLAALWETGQVSVVVNTPVSEADWITQRIRHDGGLGDVNATRFAHATIAEAATLAHGQGAVTPDIQQKDNLLYLVFSQVGDLAFRLFKIDRDFSDSLNLHIHWTKSADANVFMQTVRWRIDYKVFQSTTGLPGNGAGAGAFVDTGDQVYNVNDANADRTVFRTANLPIAGAVAGYYLAVKISSLTPGAGTPLNNPALVSLDMTYNAFINIPT